MIDAVTEAHVGKDLKGSGGHSESFQFDRHIDFASAERRRFVGPMLEGLAGT
jgi:hypothetical protein